MNEGHLLFSFVCGEGSCRRPLPGGGARAAVVRRGGGARAAVVRRGGAGHSWARCAFLLPAAGKQGYAVFLPVGGQHDLELCWNSNSMRRVTAWLRAFRRARQEARAAQTAVNTSAVGKSVGRAAKAFAEGHGALWKRRGAKTAQKCEKNGNHLCVRKPFGRVSYTVGEVGILPSFQEDALSFGEFLFFCEKSTNSFLHSLDIYISFLYNSFVTLFGGSEKNKF